MNTSVRLEYQNLDNVSCVSKYIFFSAYVTYNAGAGAVSIRLAI